MQPDARHVVRVLNGLIETTLSNVHGYREAAAHAREPRFKAMLEERAERRQALSKRLADEVRTFGGEPPRDESLAARVHERFVAFKEGRGDDVTVVDEVEEGEDVMKHRFAKAAKEPELPPRVRDWLVELSTQVRAEHDEISRLKKQMH
ncbi:PA2169 family four-helix-bundle protein [Caulobacter sp. 17J65-9]|uniref:PA2169 family four-helix-bundle protein n=1 Tax=Caulobacter sp. 17J65-9 TaxID=2709382 RepID=UPI0013C908C9|nr:PA2169 family four-helix-bundle protein [Caulobacter sp. 17J65-9]NEX94317.1 PA2169 family four-helix-bundle protein [Caulobacter sp. 17J65-9]